MPTSLRPVLSAILVTVSFLALTRSSAEGQTSVTPDGGTTTADANSSGQVSFTVQNPDPVAWTFDFSCSFSGAVTSCNVFPSSATVPSGASTTVDVSFSTGAGGAGTVSLFAEPQTDPACDPCFPASGDGGWYDVTVIAPTPTVAVLPDGDTLRTAAARRCGAPPSRSRTVRWRTLTPSPARRSHR